MVVVVIGLGEVGLGVRWVIGEARKVVNLSTHPSFIRYPQRVYYDDYDLTGWVNGRGQI